jgi:hypothetical protein
MLKNWLEPRLTAGARVSKAEDCAQVRRKCSAAPSERVLLNKFAGSRVRNCAHVCKPSRNSL